MTLPSQESLFADRFEIDRPAGTGGMGTVYRARDLQTGGWVALKLMQAGTGHDEDGAERFAREARLLAELEHPGIVSWIAHGEASDGRRFLAMEWLDGEDLGARLRRGPLTVSNVVALARQVADALDVAHRRGVVHRDLKPANLFLVDGDVARAKILDFGIARQLAGRSAVTRTGSIVGTPDYMAPEQARGARELTPAADVFSLGCVLYECLAGRSPFAADHVAAVLTRILFEVPPPIGSLRPGVPPALASLLGRMLAKDPQRRPADARALVTELGALGEHAEGEGPATIVAGLMTREIAGDGEQGLLSLVIASPGEVDTGDTQPAADAVDAAGRRSAVLSALAAMGVEVDALLDGSLVITAPASGSATDQAVRAARAALFVKDRWPRWHVALATGRGKRHGSLAVGEVADRAAGLLSTGLGSAGDPRGSTAGAPPPSTGVRVDELTARLLELRFELSPTPEGAVLTGEERDADASRPLLGKPTPCVGRDAELGMLDGALASCVENAECRAVLVIAPPGGGKSRLRHELVRRVAARQDGVQILHGRSDPLTAGSAYGLLGHMLRSLSGIAGSEGVEARRAKLAERIGAPLGDADRERVVAFVAEACGAPFADTNDVQLRAARQDPQLMSGQITRAVLDFLRAECAVRPTMLALEDLHWADAPTVKVIDAALHELENTPLFVIALARPEVFDHFPQLRSGAAQVVTLRPLSRKAAERLVRQVLGGEISPESAARMVDQSEGNALLLEELIRAWAEGRRDEAPATVLAMLQARVGRLPPGARRVLRVASIFGETARLGAIRALLGGEAAQELVRSLAELVAGELLEERREGSGTEDPVYRFRHALMRDAAYGLWADQDRAQMHRLAGLQLEARGGTDALVLAEHFRLGGDPGRAVGYFTQAAEQSYEVNDHIATLASTERGLLCGAEGAARGALLGLKAVALFWAERPAEAIAAATEGIALLAEGSLAWCRAIRTLIMAATIAGRTDLLAEPTGRLAGAEPDPDAARELLRTVCFVAVTLAMAGQKAPSRFFLDRARRLAATDPTDTTGLGTLKTAEGTNHHIVEDLPWSFVRTTAESLELFRLAGDRHYEVMQHSYYGKALMELGDTAGAEAELRGALATGERHGDTLTTSMAKSFLARLLAACAPPDRLDEAVRLANETIATSSVMQLPAARGALAEIARRRGDLPLAEAEARAACEAARYFPGFSWDPIALRMRILCEQGRAAEALEVGEEAVRQMEALELSGWGEVALRLAVAEARHAVGQEEGARAALADLIPRVRNRLEGIPESAARARYLSEVPVNARLLALARAWLGDDAAAVLTAAPRE